MLDHLLFSILFPRSHPSSPTPGTDGSLFHSFGPLESRPRYCSELEYFSVASTRSLFRPLPPPLEWESARDHNGLSWVSFCIQPFFFVYKCYILFSCRGSKLLLNTFCSASFSLACAPCGIFFLSCCFLAFPSVSLALLFLDFRHNYLSRFLLSRQCLDDGIAPLPVRTAGEAPLGRLFSSPLATAGPSILLFTSRVPFTIPSATTT